MVRKQSVLIPRSKKKNKASRVYNMFDTELCTTYGLGLTRDYSIELIDAVVRGISEYHIFKARM
jgi:hypothetical protein